MGIQTLSKAPHDRMECRGEKFVGKYFIKLLLTYFIKIIFFSLKENEIYFLESQKKKVQIKLKFPNILNLFINLNQNIHQTTKERR